jgi:hypothetical protein
MIITFSPIRSDDTLELSRADDVLTVNGQTLDFGPLPEGGQLPAVATGCPWFVPGSLITRAGGQLHLVLYLPHGAAAPEARRFPQPVTVTLNGPIMLPGDTP